jgi:hypothetical protein
MPNSKINWSWVWDLAGHPVHRSGTFVQIPINELGYSDVTQDGARFRVFRAGFKHAIQSP